MHSSSAALVRLALLINLVVHVAAFWRMDCHSPNGHARIDPIVNPGGVSEHMHSIHGGSSFGPNSNTDSLLASKCSSCLVTQDKSAYWTPSMYFKDASGKFTLVPEIGGMLAYYLLYPNAGETKVTAFPKDFKMIAGDSKQRSFNLPFPDPPQSGWVFDPAQSSQAGLRQKAVGFNCLNYGAPPEGTLYRHFLPDKAYLDANCPNGIRGEMQFPSCWNGKDLDSADHKSHVAYPSLVMTGDCPPGFPVRLVTMLFETIYDTASFKGRDGSFVFSNGDPTGYGYHADFLMGWDEGFLQNAVNTCTNPSGQISDCPLFNIQSQAQGATCALDSIPPALAAEDFQGPMNSLPNNVAIFGGPGYPSAAPAPSVPVQSSAYSAPAAASSQPGNPGGVFATVSTSSSKPAAAVPAPSSTLVVVNQGNALSTATPSPPAQTPAAPAATAPPVAPQNPDAALVLSTIYQTKDGQVLEIVVVEEIVTYTQPAMKERRDRIRRHNHIHRHLGRDT